MGQRMGKIIYQQPPSFLLLFLTLYAVCGVDASKRVPRNPEEGFY